MATSETPSHWCSDKRVTLDVCGSVLPLFSSRYLFILLLEHLVPSLWVQTLALPFISQSASNGASCQGKSRAYSGTIVPEYALDSLIVIAEFLIKSEMFRQFQLSATSDWWMRLWSFWTSQIVNRMSSLQNNCLAAKDWIVLDPF